MSLKKVAVTLVVLGLVYAAPSFAQATKPKSFYGYVHGGWAGIQEDADRILDDGWNLGGGVNWWPTDSPVGLQVELTYNTFDLVRQAASALGADNGELQVWTIGPNIQWAAPTEGVVGFYLMGGLSVDYLRGRLTETVGLIVCDPFYWWWCYPTTGDAVKSSESSWEFGYQAGLGLSFELDSGTLLYLEGRYHWIDEETRGGASAAFVPIMFGVRW